MAKTIRISLEEYRKHVAHEDKVQFDSGLVSLRGQKQKLRYAVFCTVCQQYVGTYIEVAADQTNFAEFPKPTIGGR